NRPPTPPLSTLEPGQLRRVAATPLAPVIVDLRPPSAEGLIAGACRRDPSRLDGWAEAWPADTPIVLYGAADEPEVADAARHLAAMGRQAAVLAGGMTAWRDAGGPWLTAHQFAEPGAEASRWITHQRPRIDRIACPWLVLRFVDRQAQFHYAPA